MKIGKGIFPIKLEIIDLEEIPERIDISINLPEKKPTEAAKRPPKPKNTIALF